MCVCVCVCVCVLCVCCVCVCVAMQLSFCYQVHKGQCGLLYLSFTMTSVGNVSGIRTFMRAQRNLEEWVGVYTDRLV